MPAPSGRCATPAGFGPVPRQSLPRAEQIIGMHRPLDRRGVVQAPGRRPIQPTSIATRNGRRLEPCSPEMARDAAAAGECVGTELSPPRPHPAGARRVCAASSTPTVDRRRHGNEFSRGRHPRPGYGVAGRIDLLGVTAGGRPVVVDLKWHRPTSIEADLGFGAALQVGVYGRHVSDAARRRRRRAISCYGRAGSSPATPAAAGIVAGGPSAKDTWERAAPSRSAPPSSTWGQGGLVRP